MKRIVINLFHLYPAYIDISGNYFIYKFMHPFWEGKNHLALLLLHIRTKTFDPETRKQELFEANCFCDQSFTSKLFLRILFRKSFLFVSITYTAFIALAGYIHQMAAAVLLRSHHRCFRPSHARSFFPRSPMQSIVIFPLRSSSNPSCSCASNFGLWWILEGVEQRKVSCTWFL